MAISVKLEAFEGPLDLLLHLIEKNKIDIYDIPIVEITAQYLDYIRQMQRENIIVLDILDGLYFPPKEFIDAVMDCPEYASEEYKDFIRAYTEHNFWGENKQVIENIETACLLIQ